ncbi:Prephenate dehydratase-associated ABC transporter, substrate-binding protein [hydrothermal vent metagenome]|uniref:Prephenate dehydratase-associated ABC transporter, substrate-binding protein n=1 Tax=hydrothermal vent metagenome TaxID=652676 RepID=A0A3B0U6T6_9ZZZZ
MTADGWHEGLGLNRRRLLAGTAALALAPLMPRLAYAAGPKHGLSVFGGLKYGPGFTAFDYVNTEAPKGGRIIITAPNWGYNQNPSTFNTLNGHVNKGDAPPRIEFIYDSLMVQSLDEPNSAYGLVAETVEISESGNAYTFRLRAEARWHDGSAITAEDIAFSLLTLQEKGETSIRLRLKEMASVDIEGAARVTVRFSGKQSLLLPLFVVGLPIFPKAYWEPRDFTASTLERPPGSGPYRIGRFTAGRFIEYDRVKDYWARDLAVTRGHYHFDTVRLEFFRDRTTAFEAFKKGAITVREEFTSKQWATGYDFPAIRQGRVLKVLFPAETRPKLQAWFFNTRRAKFADPRTREAIGLAFDFEWTNKNLFYDSYARANSYFDSSPYAATGSPSAKELALLEPLRGQIPKTVFGEAIIPPVSDGTGRDRRNRAKASKLLKAAGWALKDGRLEDTAGEALEIEFLINAPVFERVLGKFIDALKLLGIKATTRLVDPAQFQRRLLDFDYDIVGRAFSFSPTPIEDLGAFFRSDSRDAPGSNNYAGIADPAIDTLIEAVSRSKDQAELVVAMRALDRVLRAKFYTVPNWTSPNHRMAYWDMFGIPEEKPDYAFPFEVTWWYDAAKARAIGMEI